MGGGSNQGGQEFGSYNQGYGGGAMRQGNQGGGRSQPYGKDT